MTGPFKTSKGIIETMNPLKVVNDGLIEGIERSAVTPLYGTPTLASSSPVIAVACDEF